MKLHKLIKINEKNSINIVDDIDIEGISFDSRKVKRGDLFIAIKGNNYDGHCFIEEAFKKGAKAAIIGKKELLNCADKPLVYVSNTRKALGNISQKFYGNPSKNLKVIAVTGTNGKTTTVFLIREMLGGDKIAARCSTVGFSFSGYEETLKETTPDPITLARLMKFTVENGGKYFVCEASSHGLHQLRLQGIKISGAVFTTFSRDHLDYHRNVEEYFKAKLSLFKNLNQNSFAFLNWDYPIIRECAKQTKAKVFSYGIETTADYMIKDIVYGDDLVAFTLNHRGDSENFMTSYKEKYNLYNLLSALSVGEAFGVSIEKLKQIALNPPKVPGRLEEIKQGQLFNLFVDFAHNPEGLSEVLLNLKKKSEGKLIVIFGAVGEGDKGKRPLMGEIVGIYADFSIITTDNPKSEDPDVIANHIKEGFLSLNKIEGKDFIVELDRKKAIELGINMARQGDTLLIAGRGHESEQVFKNHIVKLNDVEYAKEVLINLRG